MVDVAHDGDHGSAGLQGHVLVLGAFLEEGVGIVQLGGDGLVPHFLDHDHGRFLVQHLVDGDHGPHLHHGLDDFGGLHRHLVGQIGDGDGFRHVHFAHHRLGGGLEAALTVVALARFLVAVLGFAPAAAGIGATGLEALLALAVIGGTAGILAFLAGFRLLVQGALVAGGFLGLGLGCRLLLGEFGGLGGSGGLFGLLPEACQFGFAFLFFLEFLGLAFEQFALPAFLGGADLHFGLVDHRSLGSGRRRRLDHRGRFHDLGHFDDGCTFEQCLRRIALDEDALLAHLHLHRAGAALGIGGLDLAGLFAGQGDLGLGLGFAVGAPQVIEQLGLVLISQRIGAAFFVDAGLGQLLEQGLHGHFEFGRELRNASCCHYCYLPLTRTSEPVP